MFEPKTGSCFHCGSTCTFPCNWKNDWYICDDCIAECVPLLRRKKSKGLIFRSDSKLKLYTLWKPFKVMDLNLIKGTLEYKLKNNETLFNPTLVLCSGNFEFDEAGELIRVTNRDGYVSPVFSVSEVKTFYVQLVYENDSTGDTATDVFRNAQICIELNNEYVPFVDFDYDFPESGKGLLRNKKKMTAELDRLLGGILKIKPSAPKKLILDEFQMMMEYNPHTEGQIIGELIADTADKHIGEGAGDEIKQLYK